MQFSFEAKICIPIPIPFHTENFNFRHIYIKPLEKEMSSLFSKVVILN